ncbi:MAG: DUF59 domain-containing protein [Gemmatimonadetes bacterium]|nr:MAG: DUF59 domain-containing protein [Gemmatimonadota bacterium]
MAFLGIFKRDDADTTATSSSLSQQQVIEVLKQCYPPNNPQSVYDLGLVSLVEVENGNVHIDLTVDRPKSPETKALVEKIDAQVRTLGGLEELTIDVHGKKNTQSTDLTEADIIDVIKTCYDPEIPVNIYELGLIYGIEILDGGVVDIKMTLTAPNCPAAQSLPEEVRYKISQLDGVQDVNVNIVWTPPWTPDLMSESARLELGIF